MKKIINKIRVLALVVTILTVIPLFINYLNGADPGNQLIINLHVWFGLIFIILAIISMFLEKKSKTQ